jgi:plastocyanin
MAYMVATFLALAERCHRPRGLLTKRCFSSGRLSDIVCNIAAIMIFRCKLAGRRVRSAAQLLGALAGLTCALSGHSADAANIRGRLVGFEHLRNPIWVAAKDPDHHGYSFREPVTTVPAGMRKLFPAISKEVCIVALGTGAAAAAKPVSVRVSGGRTTPVTLVVAPGTELRFKNSDPFDHRLFGVGFTSLAPSTMTKGATRRWTALEAGRYEIRDELTPSLNMWVIAQASVAATTFPASDGRFTLNVDEPGQYTVQAYFAGEAVGKPLQVTVERRDVDVSGRPLVLATKDPVEDNNP